MDRTKTHRFAMHPAGAAALGTVLLFGGGGWVLIDGVQHRSLRELLVGDGPLVFQCLLGLGAGLVIAAVASWLIDRPFMAPVKDRYVRLLGPMVSGNIGIVLVAVCAGLGEEILFRGAVQFWIGIPLTAIVFVAIHGYLDPRDARISVYGIVLTLGMLLQGWMAATWGLAGPVVAHTVIDVVLLRKLARAFGRTDQSVG